MMRFGKRGLNLAANAAVTAATKVSSVCLMGTETFGTFLMYSVCINVHTDLND